MCMYCKCREVSAAVQRSCEFASRLEEIVRKAKNFLQEISVIDYQKAA